MVVDTSAIAAILFSEPEASAMEAKIVRDPSRMISAATWLEASIVVEARLGDAGQRELALWFQRIGCEVVPVDQEQADMGRRAWHRFGKGRHAAALNYGDCFSYALSVTRHEPLLFVGENFSKTDVAPCL
jgi:ribonuclease VapC